MELVIPKAIYESMIDHGNEGLPFEACGVLSGRANQVNHIWELENEWKSPHRFFVSEDKVAETWLAIENEEEHVLAIYHTHPTSRAVPSSQDIQYHPSSAIFMIIISYKLALDVKAYRVNDKNAIEVPIIIE